MQMTDEECKALLAEAKAAYHTLMMGTRARVIVDQNGQRVEFAASNKGDLYAYIQSLEAKCPCVPDAGHHHNAYAPAGFIF